MHCYIIVSGWNSALPAEHTVFVLFVYYRLIFMALEYASLQECYAVDPITSSTPLTNFTQSTVAQLPQLHLLTSPKAQSLNFPSLHTHIFTLRSAKRSC